MAGTGTNATSDGRHRAERQSSVNVFVRIVV